jgi:hypothetical protein
MQTANDAFDSFLNFLVGCLLVNMPFAARAQELVDFPAALAGGGLSAEKVAAVYSRPSNQNAGEKRPAIVLLHSAWGWSDEHEGTSRYAYESTQGRMMTMTTEIQKPAKTL